MIDEEIDLTLEGKFHTREINSSRIKFQSKEVFSPLIRKFEAIPWYGQNSEVKLKRDYGDGVSDILNTTIRTSFDDTIMKMNINHEDTLYYFNLLMYDEMGANPFSSTNECLACGRKTVDTIKNRYRYRVCQNEQSEKIPWNRAIPDFERTIYDF